jgi:hypothetical protein
MLREADLRAIHQVEAMGPRTTLEQAGALPCTPAGQRNTACVRGAAGTLRSLVAVFITTPPLLARAT